MPKLNSTNSQSSRNLTSNSKSESQTKKPAPEQTISNQLSNLIQTNKIPHPPPQSTRPASTSVRKIRLPSAVKTNNNNNFPQSDLSKTHTQNSLLKQTNFSDDDTQNTQISKSIIKTTYNKANYSNPDDLIQILKPNKPSNGKYAEVTNLDDSANTIVYSFASKPKPVQQASNGSVSAKAYDFRKYTSTSTLSSKLPILKDSLNPVESKELTGDNLNNNLMDSFEARMLQDMKAEMESNNNNNNSNSTQKVSNENLDLKKSPDLDYIEKFKETSGLQSPMSDDNQTTSEKYNFDVMTSSIDDTTTSLSKRAVNRRTKVDESNNYQDEMNVSLLSNLPAKSINFK